MPNIEQEINDSTLHKRENSVIMDGKYIQKRIPDKQTADNEIRALQELSSVENVCRLVRHFQDGDTVLELEKYQEINYKKLDMFELIDLLKQTCQILQQIHELGWVHLDISPSNIMTNGKHAVLIDFGLSKKVGEFTTPCGTQGYIAPEVYSNSPVDPVSDVYSLAIAFGQYLDMYLPGCNLHYLGSKMVRTPTTNFIRKKIEILLQTKDSLQWKKCQLLTAELLLKMLAPDPASRITIPEILLSPLFVMTKDDFHNLDYETVSKKLLAKPIANIRPKREPIILFRG